MKSFRPFRTAALLLAATLAGCAVPPAMLRPAAPTKPAAAPARHGADELDAAMVGRVLRESPQSPGPALQARVQSLIALGKTRTAGEQLQLAMLLLIRDDGHDVDRAQNLLESLQPVAADAAVANFILLLLHQAQQQRALAQAQQNAQTLQKQIDQIKSLETQLQNRAH
jgi:hypothetical protein